MAKPITIDPDDPVRSLLDGAGVTPYAAGVARGVATATITSSMRSAGRVQLDVLVRTAQALGVEELRIRIPKKDDGSY